jgi:hypothetical protein
MSFFKLTAFATASIMLAGTAFADGTATITPLTDSMVVDQSIQKAGGSVDLMYVMLEDPDVSALQNFCVGGCDVEFRIAYRLVEDDWVSELQVVSITPVQGENAPKLYLEDKAFIFPVKADNAAEFFSDLRQKVRLSPEVLFTTSRPAS